MKKKDAHARIYSGLGAILNPYGFSLVKSYEAFVRKTESGDQRLYVSVEDLTPNFIFTVVIGIRIDEVEEICHRFSGALKAHQKMSVTSITQPSYFSNGESMEYSVSTLEQIDLALESVAVLMAERVLPFLNRCTDAISLDHEVNAEISKGFNIMQLPYGAMTSVTLACLAKNQRIEKIIGKFKEDMKFFPESERLKFDSLTSYLSDHMSSGQG